MGKSDLVLLREEFRKVVAKLERVQIEVKDLQAALIAERKKFAHERDRWELEIAWRDRKMERYENVHSPSSTNSQYNEERAAFRKSRDEGDKVEEAEPEEDGEDAEPEEDGEDAEPEEDGEDAEPEGSHTARGPPMGHAGVSHKNKAGKTVTLPVSRCGNCGSKTLQHVPPKVKMVYDFPDGDMIGIECIAYVAEKAACCKCGTITAVPEPTLCGTSLGPRALGFVLEYYNKRSTDQTVAYYFNTFYKFGISPNAIWNARKALTRLFEGTYKEIMDRMADAPYIQMDESHIKINGKKGYAWLVTIQDATYVVVARSRGSAVLSLHLGRLLGIPVVTDGYSGYNVFPVRQRCWIHLLREAEKKAIRNGGNDLVQYERLLKMYARIKDRDTADVAECLDLERRVLDIAASYGESHPFGNTLEAAAPRLFTFLRHPGMPPHNNDAELDIRDTVVLQRNVRHKLSVAEGMRVFSVLASVARTCHKQGILPRVAVESLIRDPDWKIFKPPPCEEEIPAMAITA